MDIDADTIKIIALLPFKNEEWILREYIHSVKQITDHIVAYDDNSTDNGAQLLRDAGATILSASVTVKSGWAEHSIREQLLAEGRRQAGTHFICLDADEVFTTNFYHNAKEIIASLTPGQSLWMDWVTLYKSTSRERIDGVYKDINKNFIFCDDKDLDFTYAFLGVSRTPGNLANKLVIDRHKGSVIHYQYLNTDRSTMKRVWYMCSEHIQAVRTPLRINTTYEVQKDKVHTPTKKVPVEAAFDIVDPSITGYDQATDWRFLAIMDWFDTYGIEFFEPLDIWYIVDFKELFKKRVQRKPRPTILPSWLIRLNDIKNKVKVWFYYVRQ